MSIGALPRGSPESQGVDPAGILAFLDDLEAAPDIEMHSLMIIRHGQVVAEGWWSPYLPEQPHLLYSLSKSFTSTAAAFAIAEGLLDLDATVLSYFPELDREITDRRSRSILVRHVAAMASGHLEETIQRTSALDPTEPVRGFLLIPPDREPGSVFAYNQPCTYTLAAIVQRVTGQTLIHYLRPRLFDPLGIGQAGWQRDAAGRDLGYTGLHSTTDAIARLGMLYLQRGVWNGQRLLSEQWVADATRVQVETRVAMEDPNEPKPDWQQGYGFQFWIARHGYRGDGAYGQFCVVLPEQDAVIATTAGTENMQGILDGVWADLLPAMSAARVDPSPIVDQLAARLEGLELAAFQAKRAPDSSVAAWAEASFLPTGGLCEDQPTLTAVRLHHDAEHWQLTFVEGDVAFGATVGVAGWRTNLTETDHGKTGVPLAISGGWTEEDTLRAEVIFLETPHRLGLTCSLADGTFLASWRTVPLRAGPLSALRMPR
ncbi:MAG TPA: serine hydrolase domain-containing protein [Propionibacteriaceae bacterium]|nr:serine hydrolase domain-containing protein [Propionibacteriaceae bacterium]